LPVVQIPLASGLDDAHVGYQASNASSANYPPQTTDTFNGSETANIFNRNSNATGAGVFQSNHGLLRFDTSAILADATINSVTLRTYVVPRSLTNSPTFVMEAYD
jgi:hypothetical protein